MNKTFLSGFALICLTLTPSLAQAADFTLSSSDVAEGQQLSIDHVYKGFGCDGGNISPQLSWGNPPEGTKSFVVTAYDPDAPTGSGWWHWIAFNIPKDATSIKTNASADGLLPKGTIQARTDFGSAKFGGACPPPGEVHRYQFTVYALDVESLDLDESASPALIGFMTKSHAIASSKITTVYTR